MSCNMPLLKQCCYILRNISVRYPQTNKTDVRFIKRFVAPTLFELKRRRDKIGPDPIIPRSNYLDWNYDAEVYAFGKRLNESFDQNLLKRALVHRSYCSMEENKNESLKDNYSLIVEGGEFLSNYLREYLKESFPSFPAEGVRSVCEHLTTNQTLANVASHIGLKDIVLTADFPVDNITLANTLKSVIAALLHSSGENQASLFVRDFVITQLNGQDINDLWEIEEPLEMLRRVMSNQDSKEQFEFRLISQSAKNTLLAAFQVGLYFNKRLISKGWGESIEVAKEMAARDALKRIFKTDSFVLQFNEPPVTSPHDSWMNSEK